MKNTKLLFAKIAKVSAEKALTRNANATTCAAVFQPVIPKDLKKFSKINNDK